MTADTMMRLLRDVIASPWFLPLLFALAAVDAFVPVVPSESVVITAGVFAASGHPHLVLVIGAAAAGAFVGDHVSYAIGRYGGGRLAARVPPGSRRRAALDRAARELGSRGGLVLVVARYVPGGRTAATLTTGTVGFPLRRFTAFAAIAAASWAAYSALVGYVGGLAFEADPFRGLLLGLGLAVGVTAVVEVVRHLRRGRRTGVAPTVQPERTPRS